MTGDQIAGSIGIAMMLLVVVNRLANDRTPRDSFVRIALIWVAIIAVIVAIVVTLQPGR